MTPIGGFSLIAHSIILVVSIAFQGFRAGMQKLEIEVGRVTVFDFLHTRHGDSILRRAVAYSIVGIIFVGVSTGTYIMFSTNVQSLEVAYIHSLFVQHAAVSQTANVAIGMPRQ